ncbi:MAG: hypothetical protein ACFFEJ_06450 [Candidatus Thorarchaeota archaeon]
MFDSLAGRFELEKKHVLLLCTFLLPQTYVILADYWNLGSFAALIFWFGPVSILPTPSYASSGGKPLIFIGTDYMPFSPALVLSCMCIPFLLNLLIVHQFQYAATRPKKRSLALPILLALVSMLFQIVMILPFALNSHEFMVLPLPFTPLLAIMLSFETELEIIVDYNFKK